MKAPKRTSVSKGRLPYDAAALRADIMRIQSAWKRYQRDHRRNAVYKFLSAIFEIVTIWEADGRAASRAHRAMVNERCKAPRSLEPLSALMAVAAHPHVVDDRTLAKWGRVLRYAREFKLPSMSLRKFIKCKGGINECAGLATIKLGSGSSRRQARKD
jgi:hypothetical protein